MSLAQALLADLDDLSDEEYVPAQPQASSSKNGSSGSMLPPLSAKTLKRPAEGVDEDEDMDGDADGDIPVGFVPEGGVRPADELDQIEVEQADMTAVEDVAKVAKLMSGSKLKEVIKVGVLCVCIS